MKLVPLFAVAFFLLLSAPCPGAVAEYGYPITDPYEATILGTPSSLKPEFPGEMRVRQLVLNVIPDRRKPPIFFYDEGLCCTLACHNHKAPLVFLIAGSGSSNTAPKALVMMKALYQAGFHVISLPSPTHPNFIISASRSSIPGDIAEDAADLYLAMECAWNEVKGDIEASALFLAGYSLGGTQAAFVARLDEEKKLFNFRRVLMINPSVDLYGSVTRIEELLRRVTGGTGKEGVFFNRMLAGMAVDSGIRYGIYYAFDPFGNMDYGDAVTSGITTLEAVDKRHRDSFRYYESGYPFEYYMVRFLYHEKRELDIRK